MSVPGLPKQKVSYSQAKQASVQTSANSLRGTSTRGIQSAQRTSVFTRNYGSSAVASNGGWVGAARGFNPYDTQSALIARNTNMRNEANRYAGMYNMNNMGGFGFATMGGFQNAGGMDTMTKVMLGMQMGAMAGKSIYSILNATGVIGDKTNVSNTGNNTPTMRNVAGGSGDNNISSEISAMSGAKDSVALSTALNEAKTKQAELPNDINTAKSDLAKLKEDSSGLKEASDGATQEYNAHLGDLQEANEAKTQAQTKVSACQQKFDSAQATFTSAKTAYEETPETITGPNGEQITNPQKAVAKVAMEQAEKAMKQAETALNDAQKGLENAENKVKELDAKTEELKNKQADAKENYKQNLEDIKSKQQEIEQLDKEKEQLDKSITKFEKNLEKMKKDESSELTKVSAQIKKLREKQAKLMSQVDASDADGLSKKEDRKNNRDTNLDTQISQLEAREAELKALVDAH